MNFPEIPEVVKDDEVVIHYNKESEYVEMPLWFWLNIVDYMNYVEEQKKIYKVWKEE